MRMNDMNRAFCTALASRPLPSSNPRAATTGASGLA